MSNKSILLVSSDDDISTNELIKWILFRGYSYLRINSSHKFEIIELNLIDERIIFSFEGKRYDMFNDFKSVLFRRGRLGLNLSISKELEKVFKNDMFYDYFKLERNFLDAAVIFLMKKKLKVLGDPYRYTTSRLIAHIESNRLNLINPRCIVTNSKSVLLDFWNSCNKRIISKGIQDIFTYTDRKIAADTSTLLITEDIIAELPEKFEYSHFQEYIEKDYEIRTFYLKNKFYSMAIFSQSSELTKIDYRTYDTTWPNKNVPYKLPIDMEKKLNKLMIFFSLDNGSIDIIKGKDGLYYFLEINPIGQFDNVSKICNYDIENKILDELQ
jgi:ATP-GRASP peptide maturase of grasp-with-spasm system